MNPANVRSKVYGTNLLPNQLVDLVVIDEDDSLVTRDHYFTQRNLMALTQTVFSLPKYEQRTKERKEGRR